MASRVQLHNLVDFTGGLNLRADAFQLGATESPDMLNVEVDPRGGFFTRHGWLSWGDDDIASASWDPRNAFVHVNSTGQERVLVANDGDVWKGVDGVFAAMSEDVNVPTIGADFAAWGDDVYIAAGHADATLRYDSALDLTVATTPSTAGNWQDDYTDPGAGGNAPLCNLVCSHSGYLFAANTSEGGTGHPNRIRWSHPNNPGAWAENDYLDIADGGGFITAIMSFNDRLLIFKTSSVWALYGYDSTSWQVQNVTRQLGAPHRLVVAQSETAVFFYAPPQGIFAIGESGGVSELSESLRPMFESSQFNLSAKDNCWLGYLGQRLWFSAPWHPTEAATDAVTVFALDPTIGAWSMHRSADGSPIGCFVQATQGGSTRLLLAANRTHPRLFDLAGTEAAHDDFGSAAEPLPFAGQFTTRWVHVDSPTVKKSWRRPDFVMRERPSDYTVLVEVLHDYDEVNVRRSGLFTVESSSTGGVWGEFDWGDGTLWGSSPEGSVIERGRGLGTARAVQLRFKGELGKAWGCDALVLKFILRRVR